VAYVTLSTLHNPTTGTAPPATWGDQINDNDEYLHLRGPYICTAATRPGSPFQGQVIYETDTGSELMYYGATTTWKPRWNQPWGYIGRNASSTSQTSISSETDLTGLSVTWTAVTGRIYRITLQVRVLQNTSTGANEAKITNSANTLQNKSTVSLTAASAFTHNIFAFVTPSSGSVTYKGRLSTTAGTTDTVLSSTQQAEFVVEDMGPYATVPGS